MKAILGAVVLVLVAACSSDGSAPKAEATPTPSPQATRKSSPPEPELPPRKRLEAAKLALSRATQGAYDLNISYRGVDASVRERAQFNVPDEVIDAVRTVQAPTAQGEEPTSYVIRVRSSAKVQFVQMDDWGPWEGCWGQFGPGAEAELGIDIAAFPNIPAPVSLVLDARLAPKNRRAMVRPGGAPSIMPAASTRPAGDEITVTTDGLTALQMLGVSGSVLFDLDPGVARARVPVQLGYHSRYTETVNTVTLDGAAAVDALRSTDADLDRRLLALVADAYAHANFSTAGSSVKFLRPAPDRLLPAGATRDQTCPANLD